MAGNTVQTVKRTVKPLLSLNQNEAKARVLNLYRAWMRQIPYIVFDYQIPIGKEDIRQKVRTEFLKNRDVKDIRTIDMLVVKGQMELKEVVNKWKNKDTLMYMMKDTVNPKPKDFMSKFLSGHDP